MPSFWQSIFGRRRPRPAYRRTPSRRRVILPNSCVAALAEALDDKVSACHEGIVYLVGRVDDETTLVTAVARPVATTTPGSFRVTPDHMAGVVRAATNVGLQVVGQLHTHPGEAYHSAGDEAGARIKYTGYVSIVLPRYGTELPSLAGAAVYVCTGPNKFEEFPIEEVSIVGALL